MFYWICRGLGPRLVRLRASNKEGSEMLRKYTCEPLARLKMLVISPHTVGHEVADACEEDDDLLFQGYKQAPHKYTFVAPFQRIRAKTIREERRHYQERLQEQCGGER